MKKRVRKNRRLSSLLVATTIGVLLSALSAVAALSQSVYAQDSTINATLFSATEAPAVSITEPVDGAVLQSGTITVSGATVNATSVNIYVNGIFAGTIDTTSGTFTLQVTLQPGSNTIEIRGYSTYSGLTTSQIITVSYQQLDGTDPGGGSEGGESGGGAHSESSQSTPWPNPGSPDSGFFEDLKQNLQFGSQADGLVRPIINWLLVIMALVCAVIAARPEILKKRIPKKSRKKYTWLYAARTRLALLLAAALLLFMAQL